VDLDLTSTPSSGTLPRGIRRSADAIVVPSDFAQRSFVEQGIPSEKLTSVLRRGAFHVPPHAQGGLEIPRAIRGLASLRKGVGYLFEALRPLVKRGFCELWAGRRY